MHIGLIGGIGPAATEMALSDEARAELFSIGQSPCRDQGAEVVLLAGTDLFLAFDGRPCGFPVADCAEIHMDALHRASVGAA